MASIVWTAKELQSIISCLRRNTSLDDAIDEHNRQWKTNRTATAVVRKFENDRIGSAKAYLRVIPDKVRIEKLISRLKGGICSATELCNTLDLSPKALTDLIRRAQDKGYNIDPLSEDRVVLSVQVPTVTEIRHLEIEPVNDVISIGAIGDIHKGSIHARHEELSDYCHYAWDAGVRDIFVAGDILAGINMFRGQNNELAAWSGEDQIQIARDTLPQIEGLTYHVIGGNHDESFIKASGLDPLKRLASLRDDIVHYGYYTALIDIGKIRVELHHPEKAGAYAITYHMQKGLEATPSGMKPNIALYGHTHQAVFLPFYREIAAFYVGCFEDQSLYLKRKHIQPVIGGWILDIGITESGQLRSILPNFIHYAHGTRYECNPLHT